jgi:hypothetical protein
MMMMMVLVLAAMIGCMDVVMSFGDDQITVGEYRTTAVIRAENVAMISTVMCSTGASYTGLPSTVNGCMSRHQ